MEANHDTASTEMLLDISRLFRRRIITPTSAPNTNPNNVIKKLFVTIRIHKAAINGNPIVRNVPQQRVEVETLIRTFVPTSNTLATSSTSGRIRTHPKWHALQDFCRTCMPDLFFVELITIPCAVAIIETSSTESQNRNRSQ